MPTFYTLKLQNAAVFFSIFFISSFLLPGCNTGKVVSNTNTATDAPKQKFEIYFEPSEMLMPVVEKAEREGKMVFLDFHTDWCLPCKLMAEDVFTDPEIGRFFNENFVNMHVNGESMNGANLASIFQVKAYPTLLFLDKTGKVIVRKEGAAFHTELKELAKRALKENTLN